MTSRKLQTISRKAVDRLFKWETDIGKNSGKHSVEVLDLFSGCGGLSLGFDAVSGPGSKVRIAGAVDKNPIALESYKRSLGGETFCTDIRVLEETPKVFEDFKNKVGFSKKLPLVIVGGPPCQGFSAHRKKSWDKPDSRNDLLIVFARLALRLNADAIVMENVPEIFSKKYWDYFTITRELLIKNGYVVKQKIYNCAGFGVPQERFRAVVIAMKKNFLMPVPFLPSTKYRTVREAIAMLPPVSPGSANPSDYLHRCAAHRKSTIDVIKSVPTNGGSRPSGIGPKCLDRVKGFYDVYGRLHWDRPSITITHYARNPASGRFTHPEQNRGLTAREAARLQGFPDSFFFNGDFDTIFSQIGEAVPPPLAAGIAATVLYFLTNETKPCETTDENDLISGPISNSFGSVIAGIKGKDRAFKS